jgi:hypothetical protein
MKDKHFIRMVTICFRVLASFFARADIHKTSYDHFTIGVHYLVSNRIIISQLFIDRAIPS